MPTYIVVLVDVEDAEKYQEYGEAWHIQSFMEDYGGEFIMMSDEPDVIEGEWSGRLVVMKFPGADADPHSGPGADRVSGHRTTGVICGHGQRRRLEEVTG